MVERCKQGDQRAWEELYKRVAGMLFPVCLRYAGDNLEAQDMFQEAFLRLAEKIHQWQGTGSFEGWAYRLFVNECISQLRKRIRNQVQHIYYHETDHDDDNDTEEEFIARLNLYREDSEDLKSEAQIILSMVQTLPTPYRMVFNLFAIEGYSHKEIARMLNVPENTSKVYLHRARKLLRQKLEIYFTGKPISTQKHENG